MNQETPIDQRVETNVSSQTREVSRQTYHSPKVTAYGSLAELTKSAGNAGTDGDIYLGSRDKI